MNNAKEEVLSQSVAAQLERLCGSATFRNSSRLCRFLRYTIESAMRGEGETLKEYVIGTEVYDRRLPYHPSQDSIVRTEAKRLRNKLKEYYETEGKEDEVLIYYRSGSYQPIFRKSERHSDTANMPGKTTAAAAKEGSPGVTIAVLPFRHEEGDSEAAAIAAGITDDLIFLITSTDGCRVVASQSVGPDQSRTSGVSLLSNLVNVDQIITGSVRKDAMHVRISVTGVHPSGLETWSERFEFTTNTNDFMILEEQTASAIMARIGPQDSVLRHMQARVPTVCLSTFPEILSAEAEMDQGTSASLRSAMSKFKNLAARQPQSSRILCGLSQCYYYLALLGERLAPEELHEAKIAAVRAVQLDPDMGEAHSAMGCSHLLEHDGKRAEEAFRRALALRASPSTRQAYADQLMILGRFEDAAMQLQRSGLVNPFSHRQRVSTARLRYLTWHPKDEPDVLREEIQYGPVPTQVLLFEAEMLLRKGRKADAASLADTILRSSDPGSAMLSELAAILALAGLRDRARELVDRFRLLSQDALVSSTYQARLCMALRDQEACCSFLKVAVAQQEPQLCWLEIDPKLQDLRDDPSLAASTRFLDGQDSGWANS